jgi:phage shock protein A
MEREMERMEQSNDDLSEQINALQRKIRALERENEELKAASPSASSNRSTPLGSANFPPKQNFSKGNDAAAMANGCF